LRTANIFKGIFEMQKSTRNSKKNAKMRALVTWHPRIYHAVIKHTGAPYGRNCFLTVAMREHPLQACGIPEADVCM
jgi:hypothetical protein